MFNIYSDDDLALSACACFLYCNLSCSGSIHGHSNENVGADTVLAFLMLVGTSPLDFRILLKNV